MTTGCHQNIYLYTRSLFVTWSIFTFYRCINLRIILSGVDGVLKMNYLACLFFFKSNSWNSKKIRWQKCRYHFFCFVRFFFVYITMIHDTVEIIYILKGSMLTTYYYCWTTVECMGNTYGMECSQTCGKCHRGEQCNHVTGICPNGCDPGMFGEKCVNGI